MAGKHTRKRLNLPKDKMSFTTLFYQHIMLRKSCSKCHYCNLRRPSDITLADFWGWKKTAPDMNKDNKGVSLVFVNTGKGRALFEKIKDQMTIVPADLEDCIQPNLKRPTKLHPQSDIFEREYQERGFDYVMRKYGKEPLKLKILKKYWKFKDFLKTILGRK